MSCEPERVYQGHPDSAVVTLRYGPDHPTDPGGAITGVYTGDEALALKVLAAPGRAPESMPGSTVTWEDAAAGTVRRTFAAADLTGLTPGRYLYRIVLTDAGDDVLGYEGSILVLEGEGAESAPTHYLDRRLLRIYGGSTIDMLLERHDSGTWDALAAEAWRQTRAILLSRVKEHARQFRAAWGWLPISDPFLVCTSLDDWPATPILTDTDGTMGELLDAAATYLDNAVADPNGSPGDTLTTFAPDADDDAVFREAQARWTIGLMLARQIEQDGNAPYEREGRKHLELAKRAIATWTARIDFDGDGTLDREIPPI